MTDRQHMEWLVRGLGGLARLMEMWVEESGDMSLEQREETLRCLERIRLTIESVGRQHPHRESR